MKFLKNNKGAILFYLIILVSSLVIINDVKKDNLREENKYIKIIPFPRYSLHRFSLKVVIDKQLFQTIMRAIETNNAMTNTL